MTGRRGCTFAARDRRQSRRHHADVLDPGKTVRHAAGDLRGHRRTARIVAGINDRHHRDARRRSPEQQVRLQHWRGDREPHDDNAEAGRRRDQGPPAQTEDGALRPRGRWAIPAGSRSARPRRRGRPRRICRRRRGVRRVHNLRRQQIAAAGGKLDQLPPLVAERGTQLANALKQAVLADMDVRPDCLHQLLLAQHPASAGREQPQHFEGLGPQLDRQRRRIPELSALLIQLEAGETKQPIPKRLSGRLV